MAGYRKRICRMPGKQIYRPRVKLFLETKTEVAASGKKVMKSSTITDSSPGSSSDSQHMPDLAAVGPHECDESAHAPTEPLSRRSSCSTVHAKTDGQSAKMER